MKIAQFEIVSTRQMATMFLSLLLYPSQCVQAMFCGWVFWLFSNIKDNSNSERQMWSYFDNCVIDLRANPIIERFIAYNHLQVFKNSLCKYHDLRWLDNIEWSSKLVCGICHMFRWCNDVMELGTKLNGLLKLTDVEANDFMFLIWTCFLAIQQSLLILFLISLLSVLRGAHLAHLFISCIMLHVCSKLIHM